MHFKQVYEEDENDDNVNDVLLREMIKLEMRGKSIKIQYAEGRRLGENYQCIAKSDRC